MEKYNVGIIGLGRIGSSFNEDRKRKQIWTHAGAYSTEKSTLISAGVDPDRTKRSRFSKRWNVKKVYSDSKEMFSQNRIDIVSIACPTKYHYSETMRAVSNNVKAIFLEKPIAERVWQAKKIVEECNRKSIALAVNHTRRWDKNYILAKDLVQKGEIGKIVSIVGYYPQQIFMVGTHLIDIMRYYAGEVRAVIGNVINSAMHDPTISGYLEFDDNIKGFIVPTGKRERIVFEVDIIGLMGRIKVVDNGRKVEFYKFHKSSRYGDYEELVKQKVPYYGFDRKRFVRAVEDLLSSLEKNRVPACSGYDGLRALEIAEALIKSSKRSRIIKFSKEGLLNDK